MRVSIVIDLLVNAVTWFHIYQTNYVKFVCITQYYWLFLMLHVFSLAKSKHFNISFLLLHLVPVSPAGGGDAQ